MPRTRQLQIRLLRRTRNLIVITRHRRRRHRPIILTRHQHRRHPQITQIEMENRRRQPDRRLQRRTIRRRPHRPAATHRMTHHRGPAPINPIPHRTPLGQIVQRRQQLRTPRVIPIITTVRVDPDHHEPERRQPMTHPRTFSSPRRRIPRHHRQRTKPTLAGIRRVIDHPTAKTVPTRRPHLRRRERTPLRRHTRLRRSRPTLKRILRSATPKPTAQPPPHSTTTPPPPPRPPTAAPPPVVRGRAPPITQVPSYFGASRRTSKSCTSSGGLWHGCCAGHCRSHAYARSALATSDERVSGPGSRPSGRRQGASGHRQTEPRSGMSARSHSGKMTGSLPAARKIVNQSPSRSWPRR